MSKPIASSAAEVVPFHERGRGAMDQKSGDQIKENSTKMVMSRYEDWLKLTMACIQNQDPMNPMDPTEMATQFAHFGQIIGVLEIKDMMQKVINAQGVTQVLEAASQLDRTVEVASNKFHFQENDPPQLSYTLPKGAQKSVIAIYDEKQQLVKTIPGETVEGKHHFMWNGEDFKGNTVESGKYSFKVKAYDESMNEIMDSKTKKAIPVSTTVRGTITGGEFTNNKPMLNMRGISVPLETLVGIHAASDKSSKDILQQAEKVLGSTEPTLDLDGRALPSVLEQISHTEQQTSEIFS